MERILLIDGDITLYQIASKYQFKIDDVAYFDEEEAVRALNDNITDILVKTGFKDFIFCISSDYNYRKMYFPTYKSNRKTEAKPIGLKILRDFVQSNEFWHKMKMVEHLEADDVMGILASREPDKYVIYSLDKDMKTIPATLYSIRREKLISYDTLEADKYLYKQILTGDVVDGYKGCPRIGKVKADKLIDKCKTEWYMFIQLVRSYRKAYPEKTFDEVLRIIAEQAGQARILRCNDYDIKTNTINVWYPWRDFGNIKKRT